MRCYFEISGLKRLRQEDLEVEANLDDVMRLS